MQGVLADIQSGKFADDFLADSKAGQPYLKAKREQQPYLLSEEEGKWVRNYRWRGIVKKVYKS